jgi:hypothetical protein
MKKHVDVAVSLGMQGIHFISASQLKKGLHKKLQVDDKGEIKRDVSLI